MKGKFYFKTFALAAILYTNALFSFGQKGFFQPASNARLDLSKTKNIEKVSVYNLRTSALRSYLLQAPMEFKDKTAKPLALEIPLPNGQVETFNLFETATLSPQIAARHPEMKTYIGTGTVYKSASISISLTSSGFNAFILNVDNDAVYFEKVESSNAETYFNYFSKDAHIPKDKFLPGGSGGNDFKKSPKQFNLNKVERQSAPNSSLSTGTTLTTFRLAIAADAEFSDLHDNDVATDAEKKTNVYNVLFQYVVRINLFFRKELSVNFTMASDENLVFLDAATDGYTNSDQEAMLTENQTKCDAVIGTANYDIGHVMGYYAGTSGGGLAAGGLCNPEIKAQGASNEGGDAYAQIFYDKLIFHEMGHQFGMDHSYNSVVPVCTSREPTTSVEPGAGATVMSYAMICAGDGTLGDNYDPLDYPIVTGTLLQYHTISYQQAVAYMASIPAENRTGVIVTTSTGNTPPTITMPTAHTIPRSTPFELTGTAIDAEGDALTYTWEGTNTGGDAANPPDANTLLNTGQAPFSRTYAPQLTGTRVFPLLSAILDGSNIARGDKLPSVGVDLNYNLTVRDQHLLAGQIVGGVSYGSVTIKVDGASDPFQITSNLSGSYLVGSSQTITWDVAGTDNESISCTLVDIFLSIDGGLTWLPNKLKTATANDGSESVTFPNNLTSLARIKIAPSATPPARLGSNARAMAHVPNIFFDISNSNFTIASALPVTLASFNTTLKGKNNALLTWKTASETNNAGFDIEMSSDAKAFVKVGFVDGNGDSKETNQYSYTVTDLAGGSYYFRLKQLDQDGKFEYSTIRNLEIVNAEDIVSVYPNPTNGKLKFNSGNYRSQTFGIKILNQAGQEVMSLPAGSKYSQGFELDVTGLPTGFYNISIQGSSFTETLKFVKM